MAGVGPVRVVMQPLCQRKNTNSINQGLGDLKKVNTVT